MALLHTPDQAAAWLCARVTGKLSADSRAIGTGDGLIAWPGAATDARRYVQGALAAGAKACLVEAQGVDPFGFSDERIAAYAGLKAATAPIAASYFNAPSQQLQVIAVTGTNGKTSTAWWLAQALANAGQHRVAGGFGHGGNREGERKTKGSPSEPSAAAIKKASPRGLASLFFSTRCWQLSRRGRGTGFHVGTGTGGAVIV